MKPKGDTGETADTADDAVNEAIMLALGRGLLAPRRPARTDAELGAMVAAAAEAAKPLPFDIGSLPYFDEDRDAILPTAMERKRAVEKAGRFSQAQIDLLTNATAHMSLYRLWLVLFLLEEQSQIARVRSATSGHVRAKARERAGWYRLRAFTSAIAALVVSDDERDALDSVEAQLVQRVAGAQEAVAAAALYAKQARREGPQATNRRRQRAARALRGVLPRREWPSARIAELIFAADAMRKPPCPKFVRLYTDASGTDRRRLADWLRKRVEERAL